MLDILPLVKDYERIDKLAQKAIHKFEIDVYNSLGFPLIFVPDTIPKSV
jgi:hypothetical protein